MAHIILSTIGTSGDVIPFLRIGQRLKTRGHEIVLITNSHYQESAEAAGLTFAALDTPEEFDRFIDEGTLTNNPQGFVEIYRRHFLGKVPLECELIKQHHRPGETMLVARSSPTVAALNAAEALNLPLASIFLAPSFVTSWPLIEQLLGSVLAGEINLLRRQTGLPELTDSFSWLRRPRKKIGLWPQWFASMETDPAVELVGFVLPEKTPARESISPDLAEFCSNGKKPVLITAGTGNFSGTDFFAACVEACRLLDHPAILVSQHEAQVPASLPSDVKWVKSVPFENLVPHLGAAIHHGGIGTLAQMLAGGVPQLVLGHGADRPDNGAHLVRLGVAEYLPSVQWQASRIAGSLRRLMTEDVRSNCQRLADQLEASDGTLAACQAIESWAQTRAETKVETVASQSMPETAGRPNLGKKFLGLIEKLSPEKRAILEKRLQQRTRASVPQSVIPARPRDPVKNRFPLSFAQQRLWFLQQIEPSNAAYNLSGGIRVEGPLDLGLLKRTINALVNRHEVLRTTLDTENGIGVQIVHSEASIQLPVINWKESAMDNGKSLAEQIQKEVDQPFHLEEGLPVRFLVLRLSAEEHVIVYTLHHVAADAWSMSILVRELKGLYEGMARGGRVELPELPIQYADYAVWQREYLSGERMLEQLGYWKEKLKGLKLVELGTDKPRPAVRRNAGGSVGISWERDKVERLRELGRKAGATLFMTMLAGFKILLGRYSGQTDVAVGTAVANRGRSEVEGLIGFFVNTVVLRSDLSGDPTVEELVEKERGVTLEAYEHQEIPFEKVVEELQPQRDLSRSPLFEVMFVLHNAPAENLEQKGLKFSLVGLESKSSRFDLTLWLQENEAGVSGAMEYDSDLYEEKTIQRMVGHLERIYEAMGTGGGQRISELEMMGKEEKQEIVAGWNRTEAEHGAGSVVEKIEEQAGKRGGAVAVVSGSRSLTYEEMNGRANQLARRLRQLGVGPEVLVGICLERSAELVVALLAVLKAGGAYVPLDPDYPLERLEYMLADSGARVLLTERKLAGQTAGYKGRKLYVDEEEVGGESVEDLKVELWGENMAYMIYTSGSTGRPKGAMNTHGGIYNRLCWMQRAYALEETDHILQKTPFSFDVSVWEFFWPLMAGARLVMAKPGGHQEPEYLADLIAAEKITTLHFVPSMLQAFLGVRNLERRCGAVRRVICSGEALSAGLQEKFFERFQAELHNLYGPTEAAVDVTYWACRREDRLERVPIGRPISNIQMHILDRNLEPVPAGVAGELYIAGKGLGRGYGKRPDLTAEKFLPNPFSREKGARLYKTGDLARYRVDGSIDFLGRSDHQVKIRGFRIELSEIENVLRRHPEVSEAVVVVQEAGAGQKRLASYVVCHNGKKPSTSALKNYLKSKLPEYMVPSALILLEHIPLGPNGKIDHKALPIPEVTPETAYLEARNPVEKTLSEIWKEVPRKERVGIHDNFFELGGDSILSIQIVARANDADLRVTARQLFQNQTIAELAAVAGAGNIVDAEQGPVSGSVELTPVQQWFFAQKLPDAHHFNQSVMLEIPNGVRPEAVQMVLEKLAAQHDALRLRWELQATGWQQVNVPREENEFFEQINLSGDPRAEKRLADEAGRLQASLNLNTGPIFRAGWFDFGAAQPAKLLLIVHHLAMDGVSWRILLQDLQRGCQQLQTKGTVDLGRKTSSFRQWSARLRKRAQSQEAAGELEYWRQLSSGQFVTVAAAGAPRENTAALDQTVSVMLTELETQALLQEVPRKYRTQINDALVAALRMGLATTIGAGRFLLDLEGHGREDLFPELDISRTVGWFTTIFPICLDLEPGLKPEDALKSAKEQLRAVPNRGIGYGLLRFLNEKTRDLLDVLPQSTVIFNYLGQFDGLLNEQSMFRLARQATGPNRSSRQTRKYFLEINGAVAGGRLGMHWTYCDHLHQRAEIETLAVNVITALREIIAHCQSVETGGFTPSDFALADLHQDELDRLAGIKAGVEDIYPLSPMQEGILFHTLYEPNAGMFFLQLNCRLVGKLNVDVFRRAWQEVANRHAIFRTSFEWEHLERPCQIVSEKVDLNWLLRDWRDDRSGEEELETFLQQDRQRGFDLSQAPLVRLGLFRLSDEAWQFTWSSHHLLLDGWCLSLVFSEVLKHYEDFCSGDYSEPSDKIIPYRNFIAWLKEQDLEKAENYWRKTLLGFSQPTCPVCAGFDDWKRGGGLELQEIGLRLSRRTTEKLQALAREHRLTVNTLVRAAWALLLGHYCGTKDVVFGVTVSGRPAELPGVEKILGLFINTLPLRATLEPEKRLLDWLQQLHADQVEMSQFEFSPLVQVQNWSELPSGTPLFESILAFQNYPVDEFLNTSRGGLQIRDVAFNGKANYPLNLVIGLKGELSANLVFDVRRFSREMVEKMMGHWETLLEEMAENPERRLSDFELLSPRERETILKQWNDTRVHFPRPECLSEMVENQVELSPNAVAVEYEGEQLSYRQLNARANQLARALAKLGVGPEVRVGICLRRSLDMMVGLLAILKAGGVYVPLDPDHPRERLFFMMADAQINVVLSTASAEISWDDSQVHVVYLDQIQRELSIENEDNPGWKTDPRNLAYVLYTSGSTGKPKGVMVEHKGLANYVNWAVEAYRMTEGSGTLVHSPLGFDLTLTGLLTPLIVGQKVTLLKEEQGGEMLQKALCLSEDCTLVKITPAHLELLNHVVPPEKAAGRTRCFVIGGEMLAMKTLSFWQTHAPQTRLINEYGPTETVVGSCIYDVTAGDAGKSSAPIGRPIANTRIYILDSFGHPAPAGVAGELYIGGAGVTRGYCNLPDLTAERFLPDPFSVEAGSRFYRTGDLARYLPDGTIDYLGRRDSQVKIRGFRIELGEIEQVINGYTRVKESVVILQETGTGEKRLVAYLVPENLEEPTIEKSLRDHLQSRLPAYMLPSIYVMLKALPLSSNGKVDRRALSLPGVANTNQVFEAPQDPMEKAIGEIWREVLNVEQMGVGGNFFELGGHSLLAIQVIARVQNLFQIEMPITALFDAPTLEGFCDQIREQAQLENKGPEIDARANAIAELQEKIDQMSPEEIEHLLNRNKIAK